MYIYGFNLILAQVIRYEAVYKKERFIKRKPPQDMLFCITCVKINFIPYNLNHKTKLSLPTICMPLF